MSKQHFKVVMKLSLSAFCIVYVCVCNNVGQVTFKMQYILMLLSSQGNKLLIKLFFNYFQQNALITYSLDIFEWRKGLGQRDKQADKGLLSDILLDRIEYF